MCSVRRALWALTNFTTSRASTLLYGDVDPAYAWFGRIALCSDSLSLFLFKTVYRGLIFCSTSATILRIPRSLHRICPIPALADPPTPYQEKRPRIGKLPCSIPVLPPRARRIRHRVLRSSGRVARSIVGGSGGSGFARRLRSKAGYSRMGYSTVQPRTEEWAYPQVGRGHSLSIDGM